MNVIRFSLRPSLLFLALIAIALFTLRGPSRTVSVESPTDRSSTLSAPVERELQMVTLLPPDAIPAIDNPRFYSAAEADAQYTPDEMVLGVSLGGESRAYATAALNHHEIVNDTVGGHKIAVTW